MYFPFLDLIPLVHIRKQMSPRITSVMGMMTITFGVLYQDKYKQIAPTNYLKYVLVTDKKYENQCFLTVAHCVPPVYFFYLNFFKNSDVSTGQCLRGSNPCVVL